MKKKIKIIIPILVIALLIGSGAFIFSGNRVFSKGMIYIDSGAVYFLDENNSPILPITQNKLSQTQLEKLSSGDTVLLLHDGIKESYPGQTGAFFFIKTGSGKNISEDVIKGLNLIKDKNTEYDPDNAPTGYSENEDHINDQLILQAGNTVEESESFYYNESFNDHIIAQAGNTVDNPIYATCGNTLTKIIKDGKEYSFMYDNSVSLHNLLGNLKYSEEDNNGKYDFIIRLEDRVDYQVNLAEGWVRATAPSIMYNREKTGVCTLTDAQIQYIGFIVNHETH